MKLRKPMLAVVAGVGLLGLTLSTPAVADTNPGNDTTLAGVGSDTSQEVMEGLSQIITSGGNPVISNYKATPQPRRITTRTTNTNCVLDAPNGSGAGTNALSAAMRNVAFNNSAGPLGGCIDFARTSSGNNPTTSPGVGTITYIPFATDSVTFATLGLSNVPHRLSKAQLASIYSANTGACIFEPLLPQSSSGTRAFFLTSIGVTTLGTCVKDTKADGTLIEENDGTALTNSNQLIPFSTAQYIAQASDQVTNSLGRSSLGAINFGSGFQSALQLKTSFGFNRLIYNAVPTTQIVSGTATNSTFVGPTSAVCTNTATIELYGFAAAPTCGDTSKKNT